jgi:hypothetical protein
VEKYLKATSLISQTTLRSVLEQAELDEPRFLQTMKEISSEHNTNDHCARAN